MYFGGIGSLAINNAIYELIANAIDQYLMGHATKIKVVIDGSIIKVSDDGRGFPFDVNAPIEECSNLVEFYCLYRHNLPTADHHAPHIHILAGGLGLAVVNAASEYIKVKSSDGHRVYRQSFGGGQVRSACEAESVVSDKGTELELVVDRELFQTSLPDMPALRKTLFELVHFYPGLTIEFQEERFLTERGLLDLAFVRYSPSSAGYSLGVPRQFYYEGADSGVQIQVAALGCFDSTEYKSWVNGIETVEGGVHIDGLETAFIKAGWRPKLALIHVIMHDPQYAGPCKDALCAPKVANVVEKLVGESLAQLLTDSH
ncbi:hypothetical protein GCM10027180_13480 [Microbulbifer echini]